MTEKSVYANLPWKTRITSSIMGAVMDFSRRSDGTLNRSLLRLFDISNVRPKTGEGLNVSDITVDSSRNLWFRLFVPTDVSEELKLPVVVYFHGGFFSMCSPDTNVFDALCRRYAKNIPSIIVSVNYRLSPEHKFPSPYDDGFDTLKFLDRKGFDGFPANADLSRCFLLGDSAGGNIAHHVARRVAEAEMKFSVLKVIGLIAVQPGFGGEERTESEIRLKGDPFLSVERADWFWKAFLPAGADRDHEAVNVFGPKSPDISGLKSFPATLVIVGSFDPFQDWQKLYYDGLRRSGKTARLVEYPNTTHGFYNIPELPEASLLLTEVTGFIHSNGSIKQ